MDAETVNSVVASNFRKSYAAAQERAKHADMLPANVREMLSEVAEHLSIERPEVPALMPAKLEPITQVVSPIKTEMPQLVPKYQAPEPEEWERLRSEALERLRRSIPESTDAKKC